MPLMWTIFKSKWCVVDDNKDLSNASSSFSSACSNTDYTSLSPGGSYTGIGWPGNVSFCLQQLLSAA
jgi:hypothetical protein